MEERFTGKPSLVIRGVQHCLIGFGAMIGLACALAGLAGCSSVENTSVESAETDALQEASDASSAATAKDASDRVSLESNASIMGAGYDWTFSNRDLDPSYDESQVTRITLSDGGSSVEGTGATASESSVTISEEGSYLVTGTVKDGSITVDLPGDNDKAQIVLAGADITCSNGAAIVVENADKVFITLADGTRNAVADGSDHATASDGNDHDGVIFSHDDLTFNGSGSLTVSASYNHGIVGKDDIRITGGTYTITAIGSGIQGKDCVKIFDGSFDITAGSDGIHTSNDEEVDMGHIGIGAGTFTIAADDDGMHAEGALLIAGGTVDITKSYEGLEGKTVSITGGTVKVVSSDDGINAATGDSLSDDQGFMGPGGGMRDGGAPLPGDIIPNASNQGAQEADADPSDAAAIEITGGAISVKAGGDCFDSNGSTTITGGDIIAECTSGGGDGTLDSDVGTVITGGTFGSVGPAGMAEGFSGSSTQPSIMLNAPSANAAGKVLSVVDANGNEVYSFTPTVSNRSFIVSAPEMKEGETYAITSDGQSLGTATAALNTQGGGMDGGGMGGGTDGGIGGGRGRIGL